MVKMAYNPFAANLRVLKALKDISLVADGIALLKFALGEAFQFENGTLTVFGDSKLRERDGLIGMGGAYFHPKLSSASSAEEVFDAWEWTGNEVGESFRQMSVFLTSGFILKAVAGGGINLAVLAPIEVAVKFYKLSEFIDTNPKIKELKQFVKGNVKKWTQDQTLQWCKDVEDMARRLSNLNAELDFALFSLECGLPVRLSKSPDMYLGEGEVPVDIKNLSWNHLLPHYNYTRKVLEQAEKAFQKQHAKLVGHGIGIALIMLGLAKQRAPRSRIGHGEFCVALEDGLTLAKEEREPVLLFYHDPWTGDVQAKTEALEDLRRVFS